MIDEDRAEILEAIEAIDGVILLDLAGLDGTWKQHLDELYRKINLIRAICEQDDEMRSAYRG